MEEDADPGKPVPLDRMEPPGPYTTLTGCCRKLPCPPPMEAAACVRVMLMGSYCASEISRRCSEPVVRWEWRVSSPSRGDRCECETSVYELAPCLCAPLVLAPLRLPRVGPGRLALLLVASPLALPLRVSPVASVMLCAWCRPCSRPVRE